MVLITLIAAGLRAAALRFPPALTDEAFTFWRVCGSLGQMLDCLRDDAFVPLHYEIVWALTKWLGTDVWVMRLPSAIAGILMPYAVYRLGRLVGGRRVGVAAAAVAASSEFIAYFARNAKMYMPAWTLMTLALGSLVFFARARKGTRSRRLAWLTFVFYGVAATGMHAVVCIPVAMSPLVAMAWARRRLWLVLLLASLGTAIIMAAPAIYYSAINTWFKNAGGLSGRSEDGPAQRDNGLMWIQSWQSGRSSQNVLTECLSAYTCGIEWPSDNETLDDPLANAIHQTAEYVMLGLVAFAAMAVVAAALRGGRGVDVAPMVMALLLIALPFYAFYLRSYRSLAAPWQLGPIAWAVCASSCFTVFASGRRRRIWQRFARMARWLLILFAVLTVVWAGARYAYAHAPLDADGLPRWNPLWMPRYSGFVAPLLCVVIGGIVAATPIRAVRWIIAGGVIGLNLWLTALALHADSEVPWPQILQDVVAVSRGESAPSINRDERWAVAMDWVQWSGQPFMSILPSPYYDLMRAEGIAVGPPGFRSGQTWPYRVGPVVRQAMAGLRYQPARFISIMQANRRLDKIILWRSTHGSQIEESTPRGWHAVETTRYTVRFVWDWQTIAKYERVVLVKD
jgi:4-amino-4-deoxy-L-arabinose transferase-like glycosyltransferase